MNHDIPYPRRVATARVAATSKGPDLIARLSAFGENAASYTHTIRDGASIVENIDKLDRVLAEDFERRTGSRVLELSEANALSFCNILGQAVAELECIIVLSSHKDIQLLSTLPAGCGDAVRLAKFDGEGCVVISKDWSFALVLGTLREAANELAFDVYITTNLSDR